MNPKYPIVQTPPADMQNFEIAVDSFTSMKAKEQAQRSQPAYSGPGLDSQIESGVGFGV